MADVTHDANYLSPKLVVRDCTDKPGRGVFAETTVEAGEVVAVWGGRIVSRAAAEEIAPDIRRYVVQVEDAQFLAPILPIDAAELINHCCHPTCGLVGQITLVALRRILPDEEITFDYATTDSSDFLGFSCGCAKSPCRKQVAPLDWQRADVQATNHGHFSPYLQRRIDATGAATSEPIPFKRRQ